MRSIGFGLERLGLLAIAAPRTALISVLILTMLAVYGTSQLRFADDLVGIFRSDTDVYRTYEAFQNEFVDGSDAALVLVDGDFSDPAQWQALEGLKAGVARLEPVADVVSVFSLAALDEAAGAPVDEDFFDDFDEAEDLEGGPGLDPMVFEDDPTSPARSAAVSAALLPVAAAFSAEVLVDHPLNMSRLLTDDLKAAVLILTLKNNGASLADIRALRRGIGAAAEDLPQAMSWTLSGLPIARAEVVRRIVDEQPMLLTGGLLIGFVLGVLLLGVFVDALVVAVTPMLCILWVYGAFGLFDIPVTVLLNDLPLLVLALAFASSMHLVYAARRDLCASDYDFKALNETVAHVGPACALSILTTMIAFLSLLFAGSAAISEFGVIGAVAVFLVFFSTMLLHPVTVWCALHLGWRPRPVMQSDSRTARSLEIVSVQAARVLDTVRVPLTLATVVGTALAGIAHLQVTPRYSPLEDIPSRSQTYQVVERLRAEFGGAQAIHLPLPLQGGEGTALGANAHGTNAHRTNALGTNALGTNALGAGASGGGGSMVDLVRLSRAHEAAEAAFPGHEIASPYSVIRWLTDTGRPASPSRLEAVLEAAPKSFRGLFLSEDGTRPVILLQVKADDNQSVSALARQLETVVGEALGVDLAGEATGTVVLAARSSTAIISRLSISLIFAAIAASLLVALGFRTWEPAALTLLPNLLPVLAVGAILYLFGLPLQIASALAMTVALGIAVDDTVHMLNGFWKHRRCRAPRAALARTMREVGPVLVVTSGVLMLGLTPAFFSWSPGISTFAGFAIATIGIALVVDLVALPALIAVWSRWDCAVSGASPGSDDDWDGADDAFGNRAPQ